MRYSKFQSECPAIAGLLPPNFHDEAGQGHRLKSAISNDEYAYLDTVNRLVERTPAEEILQSPQRITRPLGFQEFYAEMRSYIAMQHWVFHPTPVGESEPDGGPDFEYNVGELDIEVASRLSGFSDQNLVSQLEEKLATTQYSATVALENGFNRSPRTAEEVQYNEQALAAIIEKIESIDDSDPPSTISDSGIEVRFDTSNGTGSVDLWDGVNDHVVDPYGRISDQLRTHAKRQRGSRPLLIYYDVESPDITVDDMCRLLHGKRFSGKGIEVSETVYRHKPLWGDYLREQGYIPESGKTTWLDLQSGGEESGFSTIGDSCIPSGNEGLFATSAFDWVAGVLFVDANEHGHILPNFYSDEMNFYPIYREIDDNMTTENLSAIIDPDW